MAKIARRSCCCGLKLSGGAAATLQLLLGGFVVLVSLASLLKFYSIGLLTVDFCQLGLHGERPAPFDADALSDRVADVLAMLERLQGRLESEVRRMDRSKDLRDQSVSGPEFRRFLDEEVIQPLYSAHVGLRLVRIPRTAAGDGSRVVLPEDPLINFFKAEELRRYISSKESRPGTLSVHGANRTYPSIGHACVLMREELEEYMSYEPGSYCKDDWLLGQRLMVGGCDPLPRRRCLARAPKDYVRPLAINESLWRLPDDRNVRWSGYRCKSFACLTSKNPGRGFGKCTGCFEMEKEGRRWVAKSSLRADFLIGDVMAVKPGEVRIGLDVSVGTGTFAARMREWNVTVVSTALNAGAPFSETMALRGVVPLYVSLSQRLPLFDNTMDLIHTAVFLDGWVDLQLLDFVLFDWDRVLRPGGLLWVDRFFCRREELDEYMYMFLQFRYKKHMWVVAPKSKGEVYLSALLEKPPRSL